MREPMISLSCPPPLTPTIVDFPPLSFPPLPDLPAEPWQWPAPPFAWRHRSAPEIDTAQPCRLESLSGSLVVGDLLGFDAAAQSLVFRSTAGGPEAALSFKRFARLTLTTPLLPAVPIAGAPTERVPAAAHERDYRLSSSRPGALRLSGRTAGHVETAAGLFLFTPVDDEAAMHRVFVPRAAYTQCEFGESAEEIASRRWIASPKELLEAIARQERMPVLPLGQSLLQLGLLSQRQLDRALARQPRNIALGEMLVAEGSISLADLQTALAHKMGFPLVDLARFPVDPDALAKLLPRDALRFHVVPLMLDGERLIVAVDKPARIMKLRALNVFAQLKVVPVLASRAQIGLALDSMASDVWTGHVAHTNGFFSTTL